MRNVSGSKQHRHVDMAMSLPLRHLSNRGEIPYFLRQDDDITFEGMGEFGGYMIRVSDIGYKHNNCLSYDIQAISCMVQLYLECLLYYRCEGMNNRCPMEAVDDFDYRRLEDWKYPVATE